MPVLTPALTAPTPVVPRVLVVDDDAAIRGVLLSALVRTGFQVELAENGEVAVQALAREMFDIVLLDLDLPGRSGLELLGLAPSLQADAQFIILTGSGSVASAVEAMQLGAFAYVLKPPRLAELMLTIGRALEDRDRRRELARLRVLAVEGKGPMLIGRSQVMRQLRDEISRVAPTRATVLITGETGTGKELVAQSIHAMSDRASRPFVAVNCSALPEGLLESELFGHLRGSFTGAIASRRGLFEEAGDGTLFLDEVGTLPHTVQVKLLRVLQERMIHRVGGGTPIAAAFRLLAATNIDLRSEVAAGRFREDLYFRLNVVPLQVPPLRERGDDILLLASYFRTRYAEEFGIDQPNFSPALLRQLLEYDWPGNVRQLENLVQRLVVMHTGARAILPTIIEDPLTVAPEMDLIARATREGWDLGRVEREFIISVLDQHHGHLARTARAVGVDRRTLYRKLKQYNETGHLAQLPAAEA